jgi:type III pantothenate kinase
MILALDIGNSQIHGGLFVPDESGTETDSIKIQFRKNTKDGYSSDEVGLFLRAVLRENGIDPSKIEHIAICSIKNACLKYFKHAQTFMLQPGVKTGLNIKYRNPLEVGADRIANAIAGTQLFPGKNLILVDFGTATTYDVVTADKEYLGGMILPGLRISMEALELRTAKLPSVEILNPKEIVGRSTVESIQSGLYFSNLHALKGISAQIRKEYFDHSADTLVIGTGGFSRLFEKESVFDAIIPELVLIGLYRALRMSKV